MSAAVYEIRILLSGYLGCKNETDTSIRLAAHLSYALHNEAKNVLEGRDEFDMKAAVKKLKAAERIVGSQYSDEFGYLGIRYGL